MVLKQPKSPHTYFWENLGLNTNVLKLWFVVFYIGYLCLCYIVMVVVKYKMVSIRFNYVFQYDCSDLDEQFNSDEDWLQWATIDRQYLHYAETTGIYQCYCLAKA